MSESPEFDPGISVKDEPAPDLALADGVQDPDGTEGDA